MKKLVAYFSASGVTQKLAQKLANVISADLFEIKPVEPYTSADLDWTNKNSRSSQETATPTCRPAVADKITNMADYGVVFVGFPIWWYVAPKIINTFLEQYDLSNKTIIPFATSGGSNMGKTNKPLETSCKGANLVEGKRFLSNVSEAELKLWAEGITGE